MACERTKAAPPVTHDTGGAKRPSAPAPRSPHELPTTDGDLAIGNLESLIAGSEHVLAANPHTPTQLAALAGFLVARAQVLGRLGDYDRAEQVAEQLVREAPADGESYLIRASVRASLHRFRDALADLARAQRRGLDDDRVVVQRAIIDQAVGRLGQALAARSRIAKEYPILKNLGAEASVRADRGEVEQAEQLFLSAQDHFRDVNPLPLAGLYLQQGLMWQREGRLAYARSLFEEAHARLPRYATATSHLAGVLAMTGERARAIELLRPLVEASDDPEYAGQLSELLGEAGRSAEAEPLRVRAAARYDELLAKHPEAFCEQAARFWLGPGGNAKSALALARRNLSNRPSADAYQLVIDAALATGESGIACDAADGVRALGPVPSRARASAARALLACGGKPTTRELRAGN